MFWITTFPRSISASQVDSYTFRAASMPCRFDSSSSSSFVALPFITFTLSSSEIGAFSIQSTPGSLATNRQSTGPRPGSRSRGEPYVSVHRKLEQRKRR